ncbi:WD repeat-containing protein 26 [Spathaspora sp. JA1]|nr:WD repeat-containing protein 26 [Spathaspora sp. JA1]
MISKDFIQQLLFNSLNDLGYNHVATELLSTIKQEHELEQQQHPASTSSSSLYPRTPSIKQQSRLIDWFFAQLNISNYQQLDEYLESILINTTTNANTAKSNEFIQILNYEGDQYNSLVLIILYFIRRFFYMEGLNPLVDGEIGMQYLSNKLLPLLDQFNPGSIVDEFEDLIDRHILLELNRESESKLLLSLLNSSCHIPPASLPTYLFGYKVNDIKSFHNILFKPLFKHSQSTFHQTFDIPNNCLENIIEQAIKYQQLQNPYYLPPRSKTDKKKQATIPLIPLEFHKTPLDFNNGKLIQTLTYHTDEVWFIKFSPSGRFMVSGSLDGKLILYDVVNNFKLIKIMEPSVAADNSAFVPFSVKPQAAGKTRAVIYCCWDPKEQYLVSCCLDTIVRIWSIGDIHNKRITRSETTISTTTRMPGSMAEATGSTGFVPGGEGPTAASNIPTDYKLITCFTLGQDIKTWTCEFLPENKKTITNSSSPQFIIGSPDKVLKAFDCDGVELFDFYGNIEGGEEDEEEDEDEEMKNEDIQNKIKRTKNNLDAFGSSQTGASTSSSSNTAAAGRNTPKPKENGQEGEDVTMKDAEEANRLSSSLRKHLESNFNRINDLAITPNGKILITANNEPQLHFYKIPDVLNEEATTRRIASINLRGRLTSCSVSKNGKYLLLSSAPEELQVWDISKLPQDPPILYHKYIGHSQSTFIIRSSFGYYNEDTGEEELVLSGSDDGYIYFWKLHTGELITRVKGHTGLCNSVDWNTGGSVWGKGKDLGKFWGSVGDDKLVKVWGPQN